MMPLTSLQGSGPPPKHNTSSSSSSTTIITTAPPAGSSRTRVAWSLEEDIRLIRCVEQHGAAKWSWVPQLAGLNRCRTSCRSRWFNYLDPRIKRGSFDEAEEDLIIRLQNILGNRWSLIAGRLPGRTDNDIKNYWNCHLSKKLNSERAMEPIKGKGSDSPSKHNNSSSSTTTTTSPTLTAGPPNRGPWSREEDTLLTKCVEQHGPAKWSRVPQLAGLNRSQKSCRLRWLNYLDPSINQRSFEEGEDDHIIRLHNLFGNRWSLIAGRLPGRTPNNIKNHWKSLSKHIAKSKKVKPIKPQPRSIFLN